MCLYLPVGFALPQSHLNSLKKSSYFSGVFGCLFADWIMHNDIIMMSLF